MSRPYKKQYDKNGVLLNPITKESPYLVEARQRGGKKFRKTNNTKGVSLLVRRIGVLSFEKSKVLKQYFMGKTIPHLIGV